MPHQSDKEPLGLGGVSERAASEAVIYCRVSSERQAKEGDGARSQEQRCRAYAQSLNYRVLCAFSDDGVSGATIDRPGLLTLLQFVQARRDANGRETIVVVDDISRLARDVPAHIQIRASIRAAGGRLESPSFTFGDSAADELVETIMAATAQFGRKGNREQVLNRMKARLEQGYWTFPPPLGYRYERHPVHKKWMVPTTGAKKVLAPALEGFASGRFHTQRELARHLKQQGFFADYRTLHIGVLEKRVGRMLEQAFLYAGQVEYPDWKVTRRQAQHKAIVSLAALARIENRIAQPGRPTGALRADSDPQFVLRNFLRCRGCGRPLTGSLAKGKYPRYHCYYHGCTLKGDSFSARMKVTPAFVSLLRSLTPSPDLVGLIEMQLERMHERREQDTRSVKAVLEREAASVRREVETLVRRLARVESDAVAQELEREVAALKAREGELWEQVAGGRTTPDFRETWQMVHTWFCDPAGMWESGSESQKRTVQRIAFTVPPMFDPNRGLHTYDLSLPYRVSEDFKHNKARVVDLAGESWHPLLTTFGQWASWLLGSER